MLVNVFFSFSGKYESEIIKMCIEIPLIHSFFVNTYLFIYLIINVGLCWVFIAAHGLSLVAESGGYSSLQCTGFSL